MFKLSLKSLIFYRKQYFWIILGLILSAAILSGALTVGSSVKASLHDMAMKRLGGINTIVDSRLNPIDEKLAGSLKDSAPILAMTGSASFNEERVNGLFVYGIDEKFQDFFSDLPDLIEETAIINHRLADKLKIKDGEELVLRIQNNSLLPGDLPLTGSSEDQTAVRIKVAVLPEKSTSGRFSLHASQVPPEIIFLNLKRLQKESNMAGLINLILSKDSFDSIKKNVEETWQPEISGLSLRKVDSDTSWELVSNRVFLPADMVTKAKGSKIVTYMANEIRLGDKTIPYSIVSAMNPQDKVGNSFKNLPEFKTNEIVLNKWTAEQLGAKVGSKITIKYFVDNTDGKLIEKESELTVGNIIEIESLDRNLMPSYPGIADEEHCRDWEPGIPMDLNKIRDVDEEYWQTYKGTPKAVISYEKGKEIWGNRFGDTTSIRWTISNGKEAILAELKEAGPQAAGVVVRDIKGEAKKAAAQGIDFGALFLGMSFFIITAALILTALLHAFHMEKRKNEMGIMIACGYTAKDVRNRFLKEGMLLSIFALIPGVPLGVFYTSKVIEFLSTIWIDAVGTTEIRLQVSVISLITGALVFTLFALFTLWLVIRNFLRKNTVELLSGVDQIRKFKHSNAKTIRLGISLLIIAVIIIIIFGQDQFVTSSYFLLAAALAISHGLVEKIRTGTHKVIRSMNDLVIRNISRNSLRSLGAVLLMASGTFLVLNTVSRQKSLNFDSSDKKSGTGGFEVFAQTSLPLRYKPDSKEGMTEFDIDKELMKTSSVVSIRYHQGDDASCLNLNRAQQPQIYGITPGDFHDRFNLKNEEWDLLNQELPEGVIPAIADMNTVMYGLGKMFGTGSQIPVKDEKGRDVKLQIVAMLANSVLQGTLIVNRSDFDKLYPAESGYQVFLIDPPNEDLKSLPENFQMSFEDYGITLQDSGERLRNFLKIEATYLIIFQMLGGLGLILGAIGFGFIILRNVQDRQGEIATLKAIGFLDKDIASNLFKEHSILLIWAVLCGTITALISWIPLLVTNASLPLGRILTILALIILVGVISCFLSSRASTKFKFLDILKNE